MLSGLWALGSVVWVSFQRANVALAVAGDSVLLAFLPPFDHLALSLRDVADLADDHTAAGSPIHLWSAAEDVQFRDLDVRYCPEAAIALVAHRLPENPVSSEASLMERLDARSSPSEDYFDQQHVEAPAGPEPFLAACRSLGYFEVVISHSEFDAVLASSVGVQSVLPVA